MSAALRWGLACVLLAANGSVAARVVANRGTAPGACQAAFPVSGQKLRARPLAVQNEGNADVFVTCAWPSEAAVTSIDVSGRSTSGVARTLSCTVVSGIDGRPSIPMSTKSVVLPADGASVDLEWLPADFGMTAFLPNRNNGVSCKLPPGSNLNTMGISIDRPG